MLASKGLRMAIGTCVQRGSYVYIYNEKGGQITTIVSSSNPGEGLQVYTETTLSIRRGTFLYIYDERGHQITTKNLM